MKQEIKERVEDISKGEVPEGYTKTEIGIFSNGWKPKKFNLVFKEKCNLTSDVKKYPLYSLTIQGGVEPKSKRYERSFLVTKDGANYKIASKDDFVYNPMNLRLGAIGRHRMDSKVSVSGYYNIFQCINGNDPVFMEQFLKDYRLIHLYNKYATGSLIEKMRVHFSQFLKFKLLLPNPKEQKQIAEILSTWDKAIELKEELIGEKKEFKRGLMQKLLVGILRFNEYIKCSNLQEVKRYSTLPEDWSAKKASSIFSNISKKNNGNEQLLSATQNNGVIPRDMLDGDVMSPSGDTKGYKLVEDGDFVISLRSFQGGIEYSSYRGLISPAYTVLKNKIPICKDFYRYVFKSKLFIDRLASSVIGIRDGKQISYDDFSFMFLPYPELKEQEKIALMLNSIDNNIELLNTELTQFKEQKTGLMQLLLTGIVRVEVN